MTLILWKHWTIHFQTGSYVPLGTTHFSFIKKIYNKHTAVKELRSKMFRRHPGWYKAVFLKKTQTIILSFDEYTEYIIF
jgi:hypothetical protein